MRGVSLNRLVPSATDWLVGGGEMGRLIRAKDWAATPLGPIESWPQSLRSAVSILLPSKAQICMFWGPQLIAIYNDAYRPVLGLKHPHTLGLPAHEMWSEFWENMLRELFEGVIETGEAFWASALPFIMERNGYTEETYFDVSYDPVRDETGRVGGIFCIVSEMTGRVLGERRLRTLRDLERIASEARTVNEVFGLAAGVLEGASKDLACTLLYDWDSGQHIARRIAAIGFEEADPAAPELIKDGEASAPWPLAEAIAKGGLFLEADHLPARLSGGPWPEPARGAAVLPIAVPSQAPYGFLVAGISPRRELDDDYRDFLRLVASTIASAATNAKALEAERRRAEALAEIDRAKTAFFSNVSHEFRTPLTLMLGPLEEELADAKGASRERVQTAYRNGQRLLKLVNTLLDFSRIEAGRVQASYVATDLAALTSQLASNFRSACDRAGLKFIVECPPLPQPVYVDRDMWEKIVLNLLSNAFKFTFEGEIEVRLAVADKGVELRVRDTGVGIAAHELPLVFERFHRVEGTRARTHEGSGIGLALVQELVAMHGGDIRVESEPGRGSVFSVRLPFGLAHLPQEQVGGERTLSSTATRATVFVEEVSGWLMREDAPLLHAATEAEATNEPAHLLIADDNLDMREHLARILRKYWSVTTTGDGVRALAALRERRFDLVISDVMMPQMDGFELLRAIKTDLAALDIPVILLSARAGEEARIAGLEAGADDYLVKPFSARELIAQVRSQLALQQARREAAREREQMLARELAARREAELRQEHMVSLFNNAPNPIVVLRGPDHVIELANPHTCRIWGRKHEDVINRPLFEAMPELRGQVFEDLLDRVMKAGIPYEGKETPAEIDYGGIKKTVYFNFVYAPLHDITGEVDGILVIALDVTEGVLARRQVNLLRDQAEAANQAKDEFLAMLGHELRNPLAPIVTTLQLMRMRGMQSAELEVIERQAGYLTRMVDDLLDIARITRGKIELRKQHMEVSETIAKALEIVAPLFEQREHRVELQVPARGHGVRADAARLAQVFTNILTNAAKYSDPGSRITVSAQRNADRIQVRIKDEGMGIAPDMIDKVFDLFVQQSQTLARSHSGLGLGLAIVRNIVKLHDGSVHVHSDGPGKGSEFVVELPALPATFSAAMPAPGNGLPIAGARSARILLVDDNIDGVTALCAALKDLGHIVATAHDGPSALTLARTFKPQIALLDIGLPVMDGYELAQHLRKLNNEAQPLQLIAITGYGLEADRERAQAAGFQHHLVKPIDLAKLHRLINPYD